MDIRNDGIWEEFYTDSMCETLISSDYSLVGGLLHLSDHHLDICGPIDHVLETMQAEKRNGRIQDVDTSLFTERLSSQTRRHGYNGMTEYSASYTVECPGKTSGQSTYIRPEVVRSRLIRGHGNSQASSLSEFSPLLDFHWPWNWNYVSKCNGNTLLAKRRAVLMAKDVKNTTIEEKVPVNTTSYQRQKEPSQQTEKRRSQMHSHEEISRLIISRETPIKQRKFFPLEKSFASPHGSVFSNTGFDRSRKQPFFPEIQLTLGSAKMHSTIPPAFRNTVGEPRRGQMTRQVRTECTTVSDIQEERNAHARKDHLPKIEKQRLVKFAPSMKWIGIPTVYTHKDKQQNRKPLKVRRVQVQQIKEQQTGNDRAHAPTEKEDCGSEQYDDNGNRTKVISERRGKRHHFGRHINKVIVHITRAFRSLLARCVESDL